MNSKAIKKQLLAAVAMVLVAAVALGSSTYAWFVASNSVTAKGMKVQAMAESGLAISHDGTVWGSVSTSDRQEKTLSPVSTKDLNKWYHATALAPSNYSAGTGVNRDDVTATVLPSGNFDDNNTYVFRDKFEIRSTAAGENQSKGLYVKNITVTQGANENAVERTMSTALRVGVTYTATGAKNTVTKIFAPVSLSTGANNTPTKVYAVYDETGTQIGADFTVDEFGETTSNLIGASTPISKDEPISVYIYIWFEGEDHNLYSDNFHAENLNVSVEFSSIPGAGA